MIEGIRWPNGPVCGKCGEATRRYATKKEGRWRCGNPECRKDFTVTTGTVMESTHIGLHKWLLAFYLLSSSKKGMSSHQLMRSLDITYKSAWFPSHRVREAMADIGLVLPMGGPEGIVAADETYHGKKETPQTPSRYRKGRGIGRRSATPRHVASRRSRARWRPTRVYLRTSNGRSRREPARSSCCRRGR